MKLALALLLAVTATAQTPAPKPQTLTDNSGTVSGAAILGFNVTDQHGCNYVAQWDAEKKVCAIHVTFSPDMISPITCTPVAKDSEGHQTMVCWYTPKLAAQEKKQ